MNVDPHDRGRYHQEKRNNLRPFLSSQNVAPCRQSRGFPSRQQVTIVITRPVLALFPVAALDAHTHIAPQSPVTSGPATRPHQTQLPAITKGILRQEPHVTKLHHKKNRAEASIPATQRSDHPYRSYEARRSTIASHIKCYQLAHKANRAPRMVAMGIRCHHHAPADGRHRLLCSSPAAG